MNAIYCLVGLLLVAAVSFAWAGDDGSQQTRTPVLVELFTSEGCSSCPPADKLLAELTAKQPVDGAIIVPLAFHVDYWDRLGWRDRFSSAEFTRRQTDYAAGKTIYTPQMIVDGQNEFVGSDRDAAMKAISEAARVHKGELKITEVKQDQPNQLRLKLTLLQLPPKSGDAPAEVFLVVAEDGLSSEVKRGENAGRTLEHTAVVRRLDHVGQAKPRAELQATLQVHPSWQRDKLHLIAFVQEPDTRKILAVATSDLPSK